MPTHCRLCIAVHQRPKTATETVPEVVSSPVSQVTKSCFLSDHYLFPRLFLLEETAFPAAGIEPWRGMGKEGGALRASARRPHSGKNRRPPRVTAPDFTRTLRFPPPFGTVLDARLSTPPPLAVATASDAQTRTMNKVQR